jgi:DNA polymerase-1
MKAGGKDNIIIDGNNLLYRIFWTSNFKIDESDSPGQIFLFLRALKSYVDKFQAKNVYCTWDKKLDWPSTNFRKEAAGVEYKAGRDDDKFKDVFEYLENIIEIISLLGVKNIYPKRMEADDVMAWLARTLPGQNVVVTTDKDLLQLVNNKITVYNPIKKKEVTLSNFEEYTGVKKEYYMSYRVVTGDKSDNIQGFPRFGLKRFLKLEHKIVTMDGKEQVALIEGNSITEEQFEIYKRNWGLMNLEVGYNYYDDEIPAYKRQLEDLTLHTSNFTKFVEKAKEYDMWSVIRNSTSWRESFNTNENVLNTINKAIQHAHP